MLCTPAILKRALDHYQSYLPTASEHLRETREKWIPIVVKRPRDRRRVCQISEHILQRGLSNTGPITWSIYNGLPEAHQIAVALNVMQAMAEHLASLPTASRSAGGQPLPMVQGVGQFLAAIPLDHATLALRNCGPRELGPFTMQIIQDARVTAVPDFMRVYINIRNRWEARGLDWDRREREEAAIKLRLFQTILK